MYASLIFQSHYGLILSFWRITEKTEKGESFQSHYGLILSTLYFTDLSNKTCCFQSHYGLILSGEGEGSITGNEVSFNPTMVWFYRINGGGYDFYERHLSIPLWSDFIPHFLAISRISSCSFQSHYGLILSVNYINTFLHILELSIPLWSDFICQR